MMRVVVLLPLLFHFLLLYITGCLVRYPSPTLLYITLDVLVLSKPSIAYLKALNEIYYKIE